MHANRLAWLMLGAGAMLGAAGAGAGQWRDGAQVYEKVCAHCHETNVGPVLMGRQLPLVYVERVVRYGNRAMPSFRPSEIDDAALADVVRLIGAGAPLAKE